MSESMDMSTERPSKRLLDAGWRKFTVQSCKEEISKKGNKMFVIGLLDQETGYIDTIYAVAEKGKRWVLKMIMECCGVECKDGVYTFEPPLSQHLLNKEIEGLVVHEPNEYINRDGDTVKTTQHRIVEFKATAWDGD